VSRDEVIGGLHAVESLLMHAPERVKRLQVAADSADARLSGIVARAETLGIGVERLRRDRLDRVQEGLRHQGVVAFALPRPRVGEAELAGLVAVGGDLFLALDGVTDPHNLGACLRSADAAGARAVIVPRDRSAAADSGGSEGGLRCCRDDAAGHGGQSRAYAARVA
jgi:23S rRNA (guanosine2251-2'-O)-methyltransferase